MTGVPAGPPAVAVTDEQLVLGEGVRWDARRSELLRLDILEGRVFRDRVADDGSLVPVQQYRLPFTVGAIAPVEGDDGWVLAAARGVHHLRPDGAHRMIVGLVGPGTRMNDATCDPQGRMWAGAMAEDHAAGGGALFRVDGDGEVEQVLDGLTIPNGAGWSPDGRTMYFIDSGPRTVHAFDFDGDTGAITNGRVVVRIPDDLGGPDGMTVDAAGDLWIAVYGGAQVRRHAPDGSVVAVYPVPATQTTCCAFAGDRLDRLYVTTATEFWTDEQRRASPGDGLVYRVDAVTGVTGRPAAAFVPEPSWWASVTGV
ncbi:MAG: SMP-30/gluconolactonase/LRE family protein [Ilumatobacteraceae bacterium]